MQLYGCNIGSLYGLDENVDIYLIGLPKIRKETITIYLWGTNIQVNVPQTCMSDLKLMIFKHGMEECNIHDIEIEENTLILEPLLQKYDIIGSIQKNDQLVFQVETELVTIGKKGFYSVSVKNRNKECQKIHLSSTCFNVLGNIIKDVVRAVKSA